MTRWSDLTPAERCERIGFRFRVRPTHRAPRTKSHEVLWRERLTRARQRRERLEAERADWERLTHEHCGRVTAIAKAMGCYTKDAYKALWDLGLWPLAVRVRLEERRRVRLEFARVVMSHRGDVRAIAAELGYACLTTVYHRARDLGLRGIIPAARSLAPNETGRSREPAAADGPFRVGNEQDDLTSTERPVVGGFAQGDA